MKIAQVLLGAFAFAAVSCINVEYNLKHARVPPEARLSRSEVAQIVAAVTRKAHLVIVGITRWDSEGGRDQVIVYCSEPGLQLLVFTLEKAPGGQWEIVRSDRGSIMVL